jgi:hypothetical protein
MDLNVFQNDIILAYFLCKPEHNNVMKFKDFERLFLKKIVQKYSKNI